MFRSRLVAIISCGVICIALRGAAHADITLNVFTDPHTNVGLSGGTIGFAYAGDKFVGTLYHGGLNALYSTDTSGGNVQVFAPSLSLVDGGEHFISSSLGQASFPNHDLYVADAASIVHVTHDGSSFNTFASGFNGGVRGILFDSVGTFGHDMLVTTTSGDIYRVDSAGNKSVIASIGTDTEGLDVAPLGTFGIHAGELIVASEGTGLLHAVSNLGVITTLNPSNPVGGGAEELSIVPLNLGTSGNPVEGFYGSNFTENVLKANADQFTGLQGDIVITSEFSHDVNDVHWNGTGVDITHIGNFPNQPEDGLFVTSDIIHTTVPEPGTYAFLGGLVLTGAGFIRRRRAR